MAVDLSRERELAARLEDPFLRRSVKTALHLRRYLPFYVFGTLWAVTLAAFPSVADRDDDRGAATTTLDGSARGTGGDDAGDEAAPDAAGLTATDPAAAGSVAGTGTVPRTGRTAGGASAPGGGTGTQAISAAQAQSAIQRYSGTTRLGIECKEGVNQLPHASYSPPCQNVYDGPNGGATFRGVTEDEIVIVRRDFPETANSRAVREVARQAGAADEEVVDRLRHEFVDYFNKAFELYGRKVKWVEYEAQNGNQTDELQSKGKENACLDADQVVKEIKAFATAQGSSPYSECAAEREMVVFGAGDYYPESWYRKYHPYLWNGVMECERISYQVAEYIGKRLLDRKAKWAGDAVTQQKTRYFGTYVPDNDGYQHCVRISRNELKEKYGVEDPGPQYNYVLDVSRFPDQAASAAVRFAADGVTTVILACDAISVIVLTEAAEQQGWHPEWMTIGTGLTDIDNAARLYNQNQVNGHLFGPSQLGATHKLIGPDSEPGRVYRSFTGKTIPNGTDGDYFLLVRIFSLLQAAGPALTPDAIAHGVTTVPPRGAPDYPAGYVSFLDGPDGTPGAGDHTAVDDAREVYWVYDPRSPNKGSEPSSCGKSADAYFNGADGCNGTYRETYGGRRFRNGEWPAEEPSIYPPR